MTRTNICSSVFPYLDPSYLTRKSVMSSNLSCKRVMQELEVVVLPLDDGRRRRRSVLRIAGRRRRGVAAQLLHLQAVGDGVAVLRYLVREFDVKLGLKA